MHPIILILDKCRLFICKNKIDAIVDVQKFTITYSTMSSWISKVLVKVKYGKNYIFLLLFIVLL